MYEKHFSFKHKPFELTPNPDFLYLSSSHKKAITYLDYGIKEKVGFILLTGEIGAGKTTIIRSLIKNLDGNIKLARINNTKVTSEQLISMINEDFGLDIIGKDKITLLRELNNFLIEQYAKGFQSVLIIDEAQNLTPDLLEEIRLLSNLETDRAKLLQIILVGQPELKKTLNLPNLAQLRQRISINYHITPLTINETAEYIKYRLTIAGNPDVIKFEGEMLGLIYQFSKGIPRLINVLCDFILLTTYVEGDKEVKVETVRELVKELQARNYWNETIQDITPVSDEELKPEPINITEELTNEITNVIKVRLVKLEEAVSQIIRNTSMDIKSLSERISRIEEKVFSTTSSKDDRIIELEDRVSKLERMPIAINVNNTPPTLEFDKDKSLVEQVEFLKRVLNYINNKLKKTERI
jgi:putative secretion ATPase (PEP-CTERM system associated)